MSTTAQLFNLVEEIRVIADELESNIQATDSSHFVQRGTIVKAKQAQNRFKSKSMWVSLGDGTYKHITGSKGLITTHDRLADHTEVVFLP
jgi:hypothetical protein